MILITGSTGLVGSHLLLKLIQKGESVRALVRQSSDLLKIRKTFALYCKNYDELFDKIEWSKGDVLNNDSLMQAMNGVDYVYHTAAMVSFHPKDRDKILKTNVQGTQNIVNVALNKGISKLCYTSSIAALGDADPLNSGMITEQSIKNHTESESTYSISKFFAELEVWRGIEEGLQSIIVNPSVILGPGEWNSGSIDMFKTVKKGLKYYTKGITGYVDVIDVAETMIRLMESDFVNERFIISSENYSYKYIFEQIADSLHKKRPFLNVNRFLIEIAWRLDKIKYTITGIKPLITKEMSKAANSNSYYSNKKIKTALNYDFIPVKDSIQQIGEQFTE